MGFFGLMFVASAEQPPDTLPSVRAVGEPCGTYDLGAGWWIGQIHYGHDVYEPADLAAGLTTDTAAPALAMYIMDDDFAQVSCDSPRGVRHTFLLNPVTALAQFMPWDDPPPPPPPFPETVEILLRWAAEAGTTASADGLLAALPLSPGPVDGGFDALLEALGLPGY